MNKPTADEIIEAFDNVVAYFWGKPREYVNRHDKKYAEEWIEKGATMMVCMIVFSTRLYDTFHSEMEPPTSIGALDDWITTGIIQSQGKTLAPWEKELSRWQCRVINWQKHPTWWLPDQWGMPPDHLETRVPKQILESCGIKKRRRVPLRGPGSKYVNLI